MQKIMKIVTNSLRTLNKYNVLMSMVEQSTIQEESPTITRMFPALKEGTPGVFVETEMGGKAFLIEEDITKRFRNSFGEVGRIKL